MGIGSGIYRKHSTTALLKAGVSQWLGSKVADSWHKDNRRAIGRTGLLPAAFIDYFTRYNDEYGHPAGDKVIQTFADILAGTFKRASDVVARVGGRRVSGADPRLTHRLLPSTDQQGPTGAAHSKTGTCGGTAEHCERKRWSLSWHPRCQSNTADRTVAGRSDSVRGKRSWTRPGNAQRRAGQ